MLSNDFPLEDSPESEHELIIRQILHACDVGAHGAFMNNMQADPRLEGYMPRPNSPALTGGVQIMDNPYFDTTSYRGGFDGMNHWTLGWTHQVTGGE